MRTRRKIALALIVSVLVPTMGSGSTDAIAQTEEPSCLGSTESNASDPTFNNPPITNVEIGTTGDDELMGTAGRDLLIGLGGEDTITGLGGDDVLCGSSDSNPPDGKDVIRAGAGMDFVMGGKGNDRLLGQDGSDQLFGGMGQDHMDGGTNDFGVPDSANYWFSPKRIVANLGTGTAESPAGGEGKDTLVNIEGLGGSPFNDRLIGNGELNAFEGGAGPSGEDVIEGRGGDDTLTLTFMNGSNSVNLQGGTALAFEDGSSDSLISIERVLGSEQDDYLYGNDRPNVLFGGGGADQLYGREGDDVFLGASGNDMMFGGAGSTDFVAYVDNNLPVDVDLASGVSLRADGNDTIDGMEMVEGSGGADTINGDNGQNFIFADEGGDTVNARGGSDFIFFSGATQGVNVDLSLNTASGMGSDGIYNVEHVIGSSYVDQIVGDAQRNFLNGGARADFVTGAGGDDYLAGGPGNDTLDGGEGDLDLVDFFQSPKEVDADLAAGKATGEGNDDLISIEGLSGSSRSDTLRGSTGANSLYGEGGKDSLFGLAGDDRLNGGPADDSLNGGPDQDQCFSKAESSACEKFSAPAEHPLTVAGRRYKKALATQRRYKRRYK